MTVAKYETMNLNELRCYGELTTLVKYRGQDNSINQIEAVAIDLDIAKQNLFVWPNTSAEVFIFSAEGA
ncbi:hypothetical protein [Nostoc sp.]|uniref:hypothetical protein n=1 Tax=Nostoc sp. TaxID=1180 RepID=UPI002FF556A0